MFSFRFFGKNKVHPSPEENVACDVKSAAATKAPVPGKPPEAGKPEKTLFTRLFGCCQNHDSTSVGSKDSKKSKIGKWFRMFRKNNSVSPAPYTQEEQKEPQSSEVPETPEKIEQKEFHQDETAIEETSEQVLQDDLINVQFLFEKLIQEELKKKSKTVRKSTRKRSFTVDRYGFPNIWQTCYMNSSLQSLLTLEGFVRDISHQEEVWSSVPEPEAQLIKWFMEIRDVHCSPNGKRKRRLLRSFKKAVSIQDPEFSNIEQKDAHEFLTSVLNQIRQLSPLLQDQAARLGRNYRCPVEKHLMFKMETIRTCKSCGIQSRRTEEFTNLSVDVLPGGSVEDMIENYQRETELEFKCKCGGNVSGVTTEFKTLPRVLILHLKRFSYTPSFKLMKVQDPVEIFRDLVVPSKQGASCFSLVSMISHFGSMKEGHYICDGVHPDDDPNQPTDHWLTFNDEEVTKTTGRSVCSNRQKSAYVLFYTRRE